MCSRDLERVHAVILGDRLEESAAASYDNPGHCHAQNFSVEYAGSGSSRVTLEEWKSLHVGKEVEELQSSSRLAKFLNQVTFCQ